MNSSINIKENLDGTFTVRYDGKTAQGLGYDEMIGLVTQISMPKERKCLQWLRTKEEIEERKRESKKRFDDNRKECLVELFESMIPLVGLTKEELLKKTKERFYADKRAAISCVLLDRGYTSYDIAPLMGLASPSIRYYGYKVRFNIQNQIKELYEKMGAERL